MASGFRKEAGRNVIVRKNNSLSEIVETAAIHVSIPVADISEIVLDNPTYYAGK